MAAKRMKRENSQQTIKKLKRRCYYCTMCPCQPQDLNVNKYNCNIFGEHLKDLKAFFSPLSVLFTGVSLVTLDPGVNIWTWTGGEETNERS